MDSTLKQRLIIVMMAVLGYVICNLTFLIGHRRKKWFLLWVMLGTCVIGIMAYGMAGLQVIIIDKELGTMAKSLTYLLLVVVISAVQIYWYDDSLQELLMSVLAGNAMNMMITSLPFHANREFFI